MHPDLTLLVTRQLMVVRLLVSQLLLQKRVPDPLLDVFGNGIREELAVVHLVLRHCFLVRDLLLPRPHSPILEPHPEWPDDQPYENLPKDEQADHDERRRGPGPG